MNIRIRVEFGPRPAAVEAPVTEAFSPARALGRMPAPEAGDEGLFDPVAVPELGWNLRRVLGVAVAAAALVVAVVALPRLRSTDLARASSRVVATETASPPSPSAGVSAPARATTLPAITEPAATNEIAAPGALARVESAPKTAAAPSARARAESDTGTTAALSIGVPVPSEPADSIPVAAKVEAPAPEARATSGVTARAPASPSAASDSDPGTPDETCASYMQRPWLAPVALCTRAFEATPTATLALLLAHANWSNGNKDEVSAWANRAIELGVTNPDVYVLLGHSERRLGRAESASAAYRRYLELAPHGWHAPKVRKALEALAPAPASAGVSPPGVEVL